MKEDLSIEQILKSIKQVILGRNHDTINSSKRLDKKVDQEEDEEEAYELTNIVSDEALSEEIQGSQDISSQEGLEETNSLLSQKVAQETKQYFSDIKKSTKHSQQANAPKTVEDLTVEIMKPYLSKWLDENLPRIVKNLVEQEIKKLISDENNINRNS